MDYGNGEIFYSDIMWTRFI